MLQNMIWVVLIPILAIFFLRDARQFSATLLHTFRKSNQRRFLRLIMTDLDVMLAHFIRAQLILAGISLVVYSVVLTALRFPYALALGFAAGAMEFIPVIGPLVAALVIVFVGFLTTYPHLWALILFFALWRVVQDYFVSPRVMSGTLELHPLAAIAAVLMGGELGGVLGVYLSIPVVATIRIRLGALAEILRGHCDCGSARRHSSGTKAFVIRNSPSAVSPSVASDATLDNDG